MDADDEYEEWCSRWLALHAGGPHVPTDCPFCNGRFEPPAPPLAWAPLIDGDGWGGGMGLRELEMLEWLGEFDGRRML